MKRVLFSLGLLFALALPAAAQSNGNGNGNLGANGAVGQEIPQPIVVKVAQAAAPHFGVNQGTLIQAYHVLEAQIICIDPVNKVYRVTYLGGIEIVLIEDI